MHPLARRILEGEDLCYGEILASNARYILRRDAARKRTAHDAKGCKVKNCTHGIGDDTDYAAWLAEKAVEVCTCEPRQTH